MSRGLCTVLRVFGKRWFWMDVEQPIFRAEVKVTVNVCKVLFPFSPLQHCCRQEWWKVIHTPNTPLLFYGRNSEQLWKLGMFWPWQCWWISVFFFSFFFFPEATMVVSLKGKGSAGSLYFPFRCPYCLFVYLFSPFILRGGFSLWRYTEQL